MHVKHPGRMARAVSIVFLLFALLESKGFPIGDQLSTERIIQENKAFIYFMDSCMTNFGESRADQYKEVYQLHFNAEVSYLQSDYRAAFKRVYSSQEKHAALMVDIVKNSYLENSKDILDELAPEIIKSKNARAKLYLSLAYRDRALAMNFYTIGTASNPKLHSYRIFRYIEAIKMARRAKRYGFLALFESQTPETKQKIYNHLFEMEREEGNRFYERFLNKNGDAFLLELNRGIEESEESDKAATGNPPDRKDADKKEIDKKGGEKETDEGAYEKRVDRRVRFRNEKTVASYLLNIEFEKAEDIIRGYVDDFNYKLIKATFEVMAAKGGEAAKETPKEPAKREGEEPGGEAGYKGYIIHHADNYSRLSKHSLLESFAGTVKVEDFVDKSKIDEEDRAELKREEEKAGMGRETAPGKEEKLEEKKKDTAGVKREDAR